MRQRDDQAGSLLGHLYALNRAVVGRNRGLVYRQPDLCVRPWNKGYAAQQGFVSLLKLQHIERLTFLGKRSDAMPVAGHVHARERDVERFDLILTQRAGRQENTQGAQGPFFVVERDTAVAAGAHQNGQQKN